jgi:hypothetical protein
MVVVSVVGCGGDKGHEAATIDRGSAPKASGPTPEDSPYVATLREFRQAVEAGTNYDAYGFAEYLPATQRAAIDAFCFVADRTLKEPRDEGVEAPVDLLDRITRKAKADLKAERDIVAPGPTQKAITKLRTILGLESLDRYLAHGYVKACY